MPQMRYVVWQCKDKSWGIWDSQKKKYLVYPAFDMKGPVGRVISRKRLYEAVELMHKFNEKQIEDFANRSLAKEARKEKAQEGKTKTRVKGIRGPYKKRV
jgi:hypothetical protein